METIPKGVLENIKTILEGLNIHVDDEQYSRCTMPHSRTNKFMKVEANDGKTYLIRINGALWPPYTRDTESDNLEKLNQKRIKTNVMFNSSDFQICYFVPEKKRFSLITDKNIKMESLEKIANSIKHYQLATEFQNVLSVRNMVADSFNRLPVEKKAKLNNYYEMIMKIIFVVEHDGKREVSSHNDLLPSSIYYIDGEVIIVDWEYSALNHPYYDLAHLSILSSLTLGQDQAFLTSYDESIENFSIGQGHSFILMKAVISFVLLVWKCKTEDEEELSAKFLTNLQDAFGYALHENSMLSELASLIPLETIIPDLLEPFVFRRSEISLATGSRLLESIQTIMNNGSYDPKEVSILRDKLCQIIKKEHPEDDYTIEGKSPMEYCQATDGRGFWHDALEFLSKICSVKFCIYKLVDGSIQSQSSEFGDNLPYLHSCAYLVFNEADQQYEPLFLFNSKDDRKIVKTKFLINSWLNKLLEKFIYDENSSAYQISDQASEVNEEKHGEEHGVSLTTTAFVPDQSVSELRSYINQLRDFRQKHNLSVTHMELNDDPLDQNKSNKEVNEMFQKELNLILSITERFIREEPILNEVKLSSVSVKEQDERKEEGHLNLPTTVSEALLARSDSYCNSDASASPAISKTNTERLSPFISMKETESE